MGHLKKDSCNNNIKILFVCTGNIFRSMSAEYILKKYLYEHNIKNIVASSAGIRANPEEINPSVLNALRKEDIYPSGHVQRKLNKNILEENDIIVSMASYHKDFIKAHFNTDSYLYDELAIGKNDSVLDIDDVMPDWRSHPRLSDKHFSSVISHLVKTMPGLVRRILENKRLKTHNI